MRFPQLGVSPSKDVPSTALPVFGCCEGSFISDAHRILMPMSGSSWPLGSHYPSTSHRGVIAPAGPVASLSPVHVWTQRSFDKCLLLTSRGSGCRQVHQANCPRSPQLLQRRQHNLRALQPARQRRLVVIEQALETSRLGLSLGQLLVSCVTLGKSCDLSELQFLPSKWE